MTIGEEFAATLALAQGGDHGAHERLYRDIAPLVLGYLRSNGAREPEDLTSEVFIAVVRGIDRFEGTEPKFRSWVLTIAHRRLVDEFRHRSRRPEDPVEPDQATLYDVPDERSPETDALNALDAAMLAGLLAELTEDQRAVITLRIIGDMPIKEVADALDKPITAVKSLQHRALATLARHLELHAGGIPDRPRSDS